MTSADDIQVPIPDEVFRRLASASKERTLSDIATEAGISKQIVSNVKLGKQASMSVKGLRGLMDALKIDPHTLPSLHIPHEWRLDREFWDVPDPERKEATDWLRWVLRTRAKRSPNCTCGSEG